MSRSASTIGFTFTDYFDPPMPVSRFARGLVATKEKHAADQMNNLLGTPGKDVKLGKEDMEKDATERLD